MKDLNDSFTEVLRLESLIALCADICRRYDFELTWTGDDDGSLTTHDMFRDTECPGPYLRRRMGAIAKAVNYRI